MFRPEASSDPKPRRKPKRSSRGKPILTPSSLPEARKAPQPRTFSPQLATPVKEVPTGDSWLHEIKYDGYRMLCFVGDGNVRIVSRNGLDWTNRFQRVAEAACSLPLERAILDGEMVIFREDGVSDFQALQNCVEGRRAGGKLAYVVYDLSHCGGYDLTHTPLIDRKTFLETVLKGPGGKNGIIRYSEHVLGHGEAFLKAASEHSLEGIVSKRVTSAYLQKRTRAWLKLKFYKCGEFIVVGYTRPSGSRVGFGALLLAYLNENGRLTYAGRVGTGFNDRSLLSISVQLQTIQKDRPAFGRLPDCSPGEVIVWVEPVMKTEVNYCGWTNDGLLRHTSLKQA